VTAESAVDCVFAFAAGDVEVPCAPAVGEKKRCGRTIRAKPKGRARMVKKLSCVDPLFLYTKETQIGLNSCEELLAWHS
jgi:hypothetical protein